jgi:hypothetical protein
MFVWSRGEPVHSCDIVGPLLTASTVVSCVFRYLERVCAGLPPVNSEERRLLRQHLDAKSLEEALRSIAEAAGEAEGEGGTAMEVM